MHTKRSLDIIPDANNQMVFKKTPNSYPIRDGGVKIISDHCRLPLPSAIEYQSHIPGRIFLGDFYVTKSDESLLRDTRTERSKQEAVSQSADGITEFRE